MKLVGVSRHWIEDVVGDSEGKVEGAEDGDLEFG